MTAHSTMHTPPIDSPLLPSEPPSAPAGGTAPAPAPVATVYDPDWAMVDALAAHVRCALRDLREVA